MKDYIKIELNNEEKLKYEVVTIYTVKNTKYTYIIYKDSNNNHFYLAKYLGKKKVDLITTLRDSEIKVGNIILKEILNKKVEIDKSHKKANLSAIKGLKNELSINLTGSTINLYLLSGSVKEPEEEKEPKTSVTPEETINIIDWYATEIKKSIGVSDNTIITEDILKRVYVLDLRISTSGDLSFLSQCTNLRVLTLNIYNNSGNLNSIEALPELEELNLNFIFNNGIIDKHDFSFIKASKKIKKMTITGAKKIDSDIINNLETLIIHQEGLLNYKYKDLMNLTELDFVKSSPYDVGISLTSKTYTEMKSRRVKILFSTPEDLIKLTKINKKIDSILEGMSIKPNGNKNNILSKVIKYTLDNIAYLDKKGNEYGLLANPLENQIGTKEEIEAFMIALINRTNINTETLYDYKREWKKVRYNNDDYYFDSNWDHNPFFTLTIEDTKLDELELPEEKKTNNDELIKSGINIDSEWFKSIPREVSEEKPTKKKDFLDLANKTICLNLDNKEYKIDPGYLIAILDTLGLSINYLMNANDFENINNYVKKDI